MERRMLLAVLLSFSVVVLYGVATGQCQPRKTPQGEEAPVLGPDGEPVEDPEGPAPGDPAPRDPAPGDPPPRDPGPRDPVPTGGDDFPEQDAGREPRLIVVETTELRVTMSERGGAIEAVTLRNSFEADKETELDLVVPVADDLLMLVIDDTMLDPSKLRKRQGGFAPPGGAEREDLPAGALRRLLWTYDEAASNASAELDAIFTLKRRDGGLWKKQYVFVEEALRFDIRLRLSFLPPAGTNAAPPVVKVLVTTGLLREPSTGAAFQYPNAAQLRLARMDEATEFPHGVPLPNLDEVDADDLRLLGARTHYYLSTYFGEPDGAAAPEVELWWGTGEEADRREEMRDRIAEFYRTQRGRDPDEDPALKARIREGVLYLLQNWLVLEVPTEVGAYAEVPVYVGPIDRHVLGQDVYVAIEPVIEYRMAPDILADALLAIYDLFRRLFNSAGLGVILMTLVVRGLMMPLSIRNQLSMRQYSRKIAKVKPKLDALKKKLGNNLKRMREEQAKLYREHGIGFPTGCLMLFVQMPIFFALFSSLRTEYSLRNEAFLWINDLGGPDKLIDFGHVIFDIGIITIFSINILPLLMVGLSIFQQKSMPKPADEQQAQQMRMMKWLPIVFAVILYNYTAALALYMVLSSAVAIAESRIVRYKDRAHEGEGAGGAWPGAAGMGM